MEVDEFYSEMENDNGWEDIHVAVSAPGDNYRPVLSLLRQGVNPNIRNSDNRTPLHLATYHGNEIITKLLIGHHASVSEPTDSGMFPLHWAVYRNHFKITKFLINYEAPLSEKNSSGSTPLHVAARYGQYEILKLLMENNASLHEKNNSGSTPLHVAAQYGQYEILKLLMENNAPLHEKNNSGSTPLHIAAQYGQYEILKLLLQNNAPLFEKNDQGFTVLHLAAQFGLFEAISHLLAYDKKSILLEQKTNTNHTALMLAQANKHTTSTILLEITHKLYEAVKDIKQHNGVENDWVQLLTQIFEKNELTRNYDKQQLEILFLKSIHDPKTSNMLLHYVVRAGEYTCIIFLPYEKVTSLVTYHAANDASLASCNGDTCIRATIIGAYAHNFNIPALAQQSLNELHNPIATLNFSIPLNSPALITLCLSYILELAVKCNNFIFENGVVSKQGIKEVLMLLIAFNSRIKHIAFNRCKINEELLNVCNKYFHSFPDLEKIQLQENGLTQVANAQLRLLIDKCKKIDYLDLSDNLLNYSFLVESSNALNKEGTKICFQLRGNNFEKNCLNFSSRGLPLRFKEADLAGNPIDLIYKPEVYTRKMENCRFFNKMPYEPLSVFRHIPPNAESYSIKPKRVSLQAWNIAFCSTKTGIFNAGHAFLLIEGIYDNGQYFLNKIDIASDQQNPGYAFIRCKNWNKQDVERKIANQHYITRLFLTETIKIQLLLDGIKNSIKEEELIDFATLGTNIKDICNKDSERTEFYNCSSWCIKSLNEYNILQPEQYEKLCGILVKNIPRRAAGECALI